MLTLGIETSTQIASVALLRDEQLLAERKLSQTRVRHAQTLVHELTQMLQEAGYKLADCNRVAVSMGPGSFTGLRIGLVFAKTLAYTTGCELVPVETMHAIAANIPREISKVYTVVDAQRGDLYAASYEQIAGDKWQRTADVRIVAAQEWVQNLSNKDYVTGPGLQRHQELVSAHASVLAEPCWTPSAIEVARIGSAGAGIKGFEKLAALEPFYLRKRLQRKTGHLNRRQSNLETILKPGCGCY
ncbi:MAG: tRNA (adenosine(37)-N6)-threonylcarbamoyltransferase complex dimerization subunit type 1 TsaB [Planctomycetaceae bacterium]